MSGFFSINGIGFVVITDCKHFPFHQVSLKESFLMVCNILLFGYITM